MISMCCFADGGAASTSALERVLAIIGFSLQIKGLGKSKILSAYFALAWQMRE